MSDIGLQVRSAVHRNGLRPPAARTWCEHVVRRGVDGSSPSEGFYEVPCGVRQFGSAGSRLGRAVDVASLHPCGRDGRSLAARRVRCRTTLRPFLIGGVLRSDRRSRPRRLVSGAALVRFRSGHALWVRQRFPFWDLRRAVESKLALAAAFVLLIVELATPEIQRERIVDLLRRAAQGDDLARDTRPCA
jgi:hypothetical protein